jgi:hypothetical protein
MQFQEQPIKLNDVWLKEEESFLLIFQLFAHISLSSQFYPKLAKQIVRSEKEKKGCES